MSGEPSDWDRYDRETGLRGEHMIQNPTPWMETEEVAAYLKVPIDTVRAWRYRGVGPIGHRVGKHVRYHRDDVDAFVRSRQ